MELNLAKAFYQKGDGSKGCTQEVPSSSRCVFQSKNVTLGFIFQVFHLFFRHYHPSLDWLWINNSQFCRVFRGDRIIVPYIKPCRKNYLHAPLWTTAAFIKKFLRCRSCSTDPWYPNGKVVTLPACNFSEELSTVHDYHYACTKVLFFFFSW